MLNWVDTDVDYWRVERVSNDCGPEYTAYAEPLDKKGLTLTNEAGGDSQTSFYYEEVGNAEQKITYCQVKY